MSETDKTIMADVAKGEAIALRAGGVVEKFPTGI